MTLAFGALSCAAALWLITLALAEPRLSLPWRHPEADRLSDSGWPLAPARFELVRAGLLAGAALLAVGSGWQPWPLLLVAAAAPSLALRLRSDARRERARAALLPQLQVLAAALASGASLVEAVRRAIADEPDELTARPLRRALREFSVGAPLADALAASAREAHAQGRAALLTIALGVEERLPVQQLRDLVGSVVERLRFEEELRGELAARTTGARAQIWAMALIVPALAGYLVLTVPLVGETLSSDLGTRLLIPGAAALEIAGVLLARRMLAEALA